MKRVTVVLEVSELVSNDQLHEFLCKSVYEGDYFRDEYAQGVLGMDSGSVVTDIVRIIAAPE